MKGDFTRLTFQPEKHYSSVRLQQGRVQLDADWNEQADILAHRAEITTQDSIGPSGAPLHDAGFAVTVTVANGLQIGKGRYYVDGILCENDQKVDFTNQLDLPGEKLPEGSQNSGTYLAYLDVWQRHITVLEDPSLREVALGGPDTATRLKTVWQVKLVKVDAPTSDGPVQCGQFGKKDWLPPDEPSSTGQLSARPETPSGNSPQAPCDVQAGGGFRGLENQLYRVEIHTGGKPGTATYKWSRDNGSVVARVESIEGNKVTISTPGKDAVLGFSVGQWVELSDEEKTLRSEPGILVKLTGVDDQGKSLTVDGSGISLGASRTVRRWDSQGAIPVTQTGEFVNLIDSDGINEGIQIAFKEGDWDYRTGDYWLIPARTLTGKVEWLPDIFQSPHGIVHHYCPLALLKLNGTTWTVESDCRQLFPPLSEVSSALLYYVSGDGQEANPAEAKDGFVLLAHPLQVGVANRADARVRFHITRGDGRLQGTGKTADVSTGDDGVASCTWELDPNIPYQQVEAQLLDKDGNPILVALPIRFNANLSVASKVAYTPSDCLTLEKTKTVQDALDTVCREFDHELHYVSGDGQEANPAEATNGLVLLSRPLQVGANRVGVHVRFHIPQDGGSGRLQCTGTTADVLTGNDGVASCTWELDPTTPYQRVEAQLLDKNGISVSLPIRFNANLSVASKVAYKPSNCLILANAETVQDALDTVCRQFDRELYYVSGDGQEKMPDTAHPDKMWLAQPLQVGVNRKDAKVRFRIIPNGSGGQLKGTGQNGEVSGQQVDLIAIDQIASCNWALDLTTQHQQVEARLLDETGENPVSLPIRFNANLSRASEVAYTPLTDCKALAAATTVQAALNTVCSQFDHLSADQVAYTPSDCLTLGETKTVQDVLDTVCQQFDHELHYVSGDGQEANPAEATNGLVKLAAPLQVGANWAGACVRFQIITTDAKNQDSRYGGLKASMSDQQYSSEVIVSTDNDRIASCIWALGSTNLEIVYQQVKAELVDNTQTPLKVLSLPIFFNANLNVASKVAYTPPATCSTLSGARTVQDALNTVCGKLEPVSGIHITAVKLGTDNLQNDAEVKVNILAEGITIVCDREVDSKTITRPTCFVTLDMPLPADQSIIGFQPLILNGVLTVSSKNIIWKPDVVVNQWLSDQIRTINPLLAHLTLKGNFICNQDKTLYLDGEMFVGTDLSKGNSGDGRRGGDFEIWFWLVPPPTQPVSGQTIAPTKELTQPRSRRSRSS